jgi:hypothetical protein
MWSARGKGCGYDRHIGLKSAGCQTAIAEKIREKQADYILAVKENHLRLYQDIREYFEYLDEGIYRDRAADQWAGELEKDHGRIERRSVSTITSLDWLENKKNWQDWQPLSGIGVN